jgi:hypothetical protein
MGDADVKVDLDLSRHLNADICFLSLVLCFLRFIKTLMDHHFPEWLPYVIA